jgi:hypothetical protein
MPHAVTAPIDNQTCLPVEDPGAIEAAIGGTWRVRTLERTATLLTCEHAVYDGQVVHTDSLWVTYEDALWLVLERYPPLYGRNGVADSGQERFLALIDSIDCQTSAMIFESAATLWLLCEGLFEPETGRIAGVCDRAEIDTNVDDDLKQGTCSLSQPVPFEMERVP